MNITITKEMLVEKKACSNGVIAFEKSFPEGFSGNLIDLLKNPPQDIRPFIGWFLARFEIALEGANLSGADLIGANLIGADLGGANFSGATLYLANLWGVNLSGANLSGANLSGADLWRANLSGANLSGANLSGANLSGVIGLNKILVLHLRDQYLYFKHRREGQIPLSITKKR